MNKTKNFYKHFYTGYYSDLVTQKTLADGSVRLSVPMIDIFGDGLSVYIQDSPRAVIIQYEYLVHDGGQGEGLLQDHGIRGDYRELVQRLYPADCLTLSGDDAFPDSLVLCIDCNRAGLGFAIHNIVHCLLAISGYCNAHKILNDPQYPNNYVRIRKTDRKISHRSQ